MTNMRIERDCLGEMEIPNDRYYGIQTIRNMKVSGAAGFPVVAYPDMHKALCQIKKACAKANAEIGAMKPEIAQAIAAACAKVIAGGYEKEFPLDMWQGGGYTCVNMNVNEVIGNLANEILTGHKGQDMVHPNTHVNMAQSTNDTIPSATHLAIAPRLDKIVCEAYRRLRCQSEGLRTHRQSRTYLLARRAASHPWTGIFGVCFCDSASGTSTKGSAPGLL